VGAAVHAARSDRLLALDADGVCAARVLDAAGAQGHRHHGSGGRREQLRARAAADSPPGAVWRCSVVDSSRGKGKHCPSLVNGVGHDSEGVLYH